jgi:hypothetical protein
MIFQLAEAYYKAPTSITLCSSMPIPGADPGTALGRVFDFQLTYEHMRGLRRRRIPIPLRGVAREINMADPKKDAFYRKNAEVAIPGLGTPSSARTVRIPGNRRVGHYDIKDAPTRRTP